MFKCKGNEIHNKLNAKIQDGMDDSNTNLEANAVDSSKATLSEVMSTEWHKLILLTDIIIRIWLENCRRIYPA